jgi:hypothetical protein
MRLRHREIAAERGATFHAGADWIRRIEKPLLPTISAADRWLDRLDGYARIRHTSIVAAQNSPTVGGIAGVVSRRTGGDALRALSSASA